MADIGEEQKHKINVEKIATSLGFNRLGAILHEIAKDAADKSTCKAPGEGGGKCKTSNRAKLNLEKNACINQGRTSATTNTKPRRRI